MQFDAIVAKIRREVELRKLCEGAPRECQRHGTMFLHGSGAARATPPLPSVVDLCRGGELEQQETDLTDHDPR